MGLLDSLFLDPTAAGGGWLANLLGITPANTTKTPTVGVRNQATGAYMPAALVAQTAMNGGPAPVNPAMSAFSPPQGLLGNSLIANGIRGGLAGLASSNGYKGFGAQLGAGFEGGVQGNLARQQIMARNALMGQSYQQGQQALIGGNINNQFALQRVNAARRLAGQPPIDMNGLMQDPSLVNNPTGGAQPVGGATPAISGGGQASNSQATGQQPPEPNWNDPGDPQVQATLQDEAMAFGPDYANFHLNLIKSGMPYQQQVEVLKAQAGANNANVTPRQGTPVITIRNGVPSVLGAPSIDQSGGTGYNVYTQGDSMPPTHIQTGLPTGQTDAFTAAQTRDTDLRTGYAGSGPADRMNILDQLDALSRSTAMGPGVETKAKWEALANAFPLLGFDASMGDKANLDIFNKLVSNLGMQYQKMSGGKGTDLQLETAMAGIPSADKMSEAIQHIVPYMKSLEAAGAAQVDARDRWQQTHGMGGKSLSEFEGAWRKAYDPRVFQFLQMDPDAQKQFKASLSAKQQQDFVQKIKALHDLGAIP